MSVNSLIVHTFLPGFCKATHEAFNDNLIWTYVNLCRTKVSIWFKAQDIHPDRQMTSELFTYSDPLFYCFSTCVCVCVWCNGRKQMLETLTLSWAGVWTWFPTAPSLPRGPREKDLSSSPPQLWPKPLSRKFWIWARPWILTLENQVSFHTAEPVYVSFFQFLN